MTRGRDKPNTDVPSEGLVLNLRLPPGTDPAIVPSLTKGLQDLVVALLTKPPFEEAVFKRADELAAAITGLSMPAAPLIRERIRRQETVCAVLARGDWFTAEQINALQAVPVADKAQPASDWKHHNRIFSVSVGGKEYYAGYQFDTMYQPLPIIEEILDALGPVADSWIIAAWFHFPNGWLSGTGGREGQPVAPMDALDRRDSIVRAARHIGMTYVS